MVTLDTSRVSCIPFQLAIKEKRLGFRLFSGNKEETEH